MLKHASGRKVREPHRYRGSAEAADFLRRTADSVEHEALHAEAQGTGIRYRIVLNIHYAYEDVPGPIAARGAQHVEANQEAP